MGKPNKKGRSDAPFVMIYEFMLLSPAWLDLSGSAVKLLVELIRRSKGNNGFGHSKHDHGRLYLSERAAADSIGVAKNTAAKAFRELIDHGFLRTVFPGNFDVKRKATTWRLTFQPYPHTGLGPTREWRKWTPEEKTQAKKMTKPGAISDRGFDTGAEYEPNLAIAAKNPEPDSEPHIYICHGGSSYSRLRLAGMTQVSG